MSVADPTPTSQGPIGASPLIAAPAVKSLFKEGLIRGLKRKCPNCGEGALYSRYITVQAHCSVCGHNNAQYRADDAGPYFTILVVGHLVVGPMLFSPFIWKAPIWLVLGTTLPIITLLTLVLLPIIKGGVIGAQWALKRDKELQSNDPIIVPDASVLTGPAAELEQA